MKIEKRKNGFIAIKYDKKIKHLNDEEASKLEFLEVDEKTFKDLKEHKLMWSSKEIDVIEPIYEEQNVEIETDQDNLESPIFNENGEFIGFNKIKEVQTQKVKVGEKTIKKTECFLIENPNYEQYKKQQEINLKKLKEVNKNQKQKQNIYNQIDLLKQQLSSTDYRAIKYAEGCYTEEEYNPYKIERQKMRDEINKLEEEVKKL